jgi:hypothetical protein
MEGRIGRVQENILPLLLGFLGCLLDMVTTPQLVPTSPYLTLTERPRCTGTGSYLPRVIIPAHLMRECIRLCLQINQMSASEVKVQALAHGKDGAQALDSRSVPTPTQRLRSEACWATWV